MKPDGGPPRVVLLGAQFGGLAALHWLVRLRRAVPMRLSVVAARPYAVYRPDLVFSALGRPGFVARTRIDLPSLCRRLGAELVLDYAVSIDAPRRQVRLVHRSPLAYDVLFWATGMDWDWNAIPGLDPSVGWLPEDFSARHIAQRLAAWSSGTVAVVVGALAQDPRQTPALATALDTPAAEWALLAAAAQRHAVSSKTARIVLVTGAACVGEGLGPAARGILAVELHRAGVEVRMCARVEKVGPDFLVVSSPDGKSRLKTGGTIWLPPTRGSDLARRSGLDDGYGWVPTNAYLQHVDWPDLYALGDLNRDSLPKMGHAAMVQARVAVRHWVARMRGGPMPDPYRASVLAIVQLGHRRALAASSDVLYGGSRELAFVGPLPYLAKQAFGLMYRRGGGGLPRMP